MAEEYWEEMLQEKHKTKETLGTNTVVAATQALCSGRR